jgi:Tol biopolymer transport system component
VSPDGRRIVFQRDGETMTDIFVVNRDGTRLRQLTNTAHPNGRCLPARGQCNGTPAWSPDGRRIVFNRAFGPVVDDLVETQALFVMRADGTHVRQLTQRNPPPAGATGEDSEPQFSPDGTQVLFQRRNVRTAPRNGAVALWVLDLSTGAERRITPYRLEAGDTPDWSPNGKKILFHDNLDTPEANANLYTIRPDGTPQAADVPRRRRHPLPRLVVLAGREVDHRRQAAFDRWPGAEHRGRRRHAGKRHV